MKSIGILILSIFFTIGTSAKEQDVSVERDLQRLDSVVENYEKYEKQKQQAINELKREAGGALQLLQAHI